MFVDYSKFNNERFNLGLPFKNIVIDNLFDSKELKIIADAFPKKDDIIWWKYDNHFEKKLAFDNYQEMSKVIQKYFDTVNSFDFMKKLEKLTGIDMLISDPSLRAGGLHRIDKGGKLDIHADFRYHRITGWKRRLNIITFLNENWKEEYLGYTEFWDENITECVTEVLPVFNRTVVFEVDDKSWHGHPRPLACPENMCRKSLATYYYTLHNENIDNVKVKSTNYKKLPYEEYDEEIERLRQERSKGRLKDQTT